MSQPIICTCRWASSREALSAPKYSAASLSTASLEALQVLQTVWPGIRVDEVCSRRHLKLWSKILVAGALAEATTSKRPEALSVPKAGRMTTPMADPACLIPPFGRVRTAALPEAAVANCATHNSSFRSFDRTRSLITAARIEIEPRPQEGKQAWPVRFLDETGRLKQA